MVKELMVINHFASAAVDSCKTHSKKKATATSERAHTCAEGGRLQVAVKACCTEAGRAFPPTPGEIRGAATNLIARAAGLPTAGEAWGAVMDSFRRTSFDQPELLGHPLVSEAIRCMGGLEVIGMSENNMADRAHFLKIFEQLQERAIRETDP